MLSNFKDRWFGAMAVWLGSSIARPVATPGPHPAMYGASPASKAAPWLLGFEIPGLSGWERQYSARTPRLKTRYRAARVESFRQEDDLQVKLQAWLCLL